MSEFTRQHPVAAVTRAVELIRENIMTIVVLMMVGAGGRGGSAYIWMFAGLFVFLLVAGATGWWRFVYRVEEGELQIKKGILVRKNIYMTRDRIQVIDVSAGVIQRLFGLVSVEVKTAGSTSRDASLSAVSRREAERIVSLLKNGETVGDEEAEIPEKPPLPQYNLPVKELIIAASTSGSFGIALSVIATVFSQIEPFISDFEMLEWLYAMIPSEADGVMIASAVAVFVIFAWLMSFFGTLIKHGNFSLTVDSDEMIVQSGLLEKKKVTLPYNRIQALRIVEGSLRQPFGYASVHVESAGYGDKDGAGSVVLFPLMRVTEIDTFLEEVLPGYHCQFDMTRPPRRSLMRYIIRSTLVVSIVATAVWYILLPSPWIWLLSVGGILLGWLRYRDAGVGFDQGKILVRSRRLARTTAVIQKRRAQDMTIRSSLIQQFRNLANLNVHVASGDHGKGFSVRELDVEAANRILPWIAAGSTTDG